MSTPINQLQIPHNSPVENVEDDDDHFVQQVLDEITNTGSVQENYVNNNKNMNAMPMYDPNPPPPMMNQYNAPPPMPQHLPRPPMIMQQPPIVKHSSKKSVMDTFGSEIKLFIVIVASVIFFSLGPIENILITNFSFINIPNIEMIVKGAAVGLFVLIIKNFFL